jgi:hypothetical protein
VAGLRAEGDEVGADMAGHDRGLRRPVQTGEAEEMEARQIVDRVRPAEAAVDGQPPVCEGTGDVRDRVASDGAGESSDNAATPPRAPAA